MMLNLGNSNRNTLSDMHSKKSVKADGVIISITSMSFDTPALAMLFYLQRVEQPSGPLCQWSAAILLDKPCEGSTGFPMITDCPERPGFSVQGLGSQGETVRI
jgi:hypothetical protein